MRVIEAGQAASFAPGEALVGKGEVRIGVILTGSAVLTLTNATGERIPIGRIGPGDLFGIVGVVSGEPGPIAVTATEAVSAKIMSRKAFSEAVRSEPVLMGWCQSLAIGYLSLACRAALSGRSEETLPTNTETLPPVIRKALDYIDDHFAEDLTLTMVARVNGISRCHLSRLFKAATGATFRSYLIRVRLQAAKKMLRSRSRNITEACFSAGFNDVAYFSRLFRKSEGMTPSAYKKAHVPQGPLKKNAVPPSLFPLPVEPCNRLVALYGLAAPALLSRRRLSLAG